MANQQQGSMEQQQGGKAAVPPVKEAKDIEKDKDIKKKGEKDKMDKGSCSGSCS